MIIRQFTNKCKIIYAFLVLLVVGCLTTAVTAHDAVIINSNPANGDVLAESPPQVTAWFAEELVSGESTMSVFDATGHQWDNGDGGVDLDDPDHASMIVTLPLLPDGSYTVQWHALLLDGDASDGAFAFAVGANQTAQQASPDASQESAGGLFSGAVFIAAGLVTVLLILAALFFRKRGRPTTMSK